jgi:VanZ family protein
LAMPRPSQRRRRSDRMLLPLRHSRGWLIAGWLFVAIVIVLSIIPGGNLPDPPSGMDKIEHFIGYAGLTTWFIGIYPRSRYVIIAVALLAMGVAIEWLQGEMNLGRSRDHLDVIANAVGVGVGILAAVWRFGGWAQRLEIWLGERSRN